VIRSGFRTTDFGIWKRLKSIKFLTDATLLAEFGVKSAQVARQVLAAGFDGAAVRSKIVRLLEEENYSTLEEFI
jgi:tryptophan synthase alpha subunit